MFDPSSTIHELVSPNSIIYLYIRLLIGGIHDGLGVANNIAAEKTGLPIPAVALDPSTDDNTVLNRGVNYASGGGGILNETGYLFLIPTSTLAANGFRFLFIDRIS